MSAKTICTESSTLPLLIGGDNFPLVNTQVTWSGERTGVTTTSTIVTVEKDTSQYQEPSQASGGNMDFPLNYKSMSPSLGGTYPGAERFQSTFQVDQQLFGSISEEIQLSNLIETIDLMEDGDLRNPIAPPMTSSTGAMVIFNAGTASYWSYKGASVE